MHSFRSICYLHSHIGFNSQNNTVYSGNSVICLHKFNVYTQPINYSLFAIKGECEFSFQSQEL